MLLPSSRGERRGRKGKGGCAMREGGREASKGKGSGREGREGK